MLLFGGYRRSGQYQADIAAHAPGATQGAIEDWNDGFGDASTRPPPTIAKDQALHRGAWLGIVAHNLAGDWPFSSVQDIARLHARNARR